LKYYEEHHKLNKRLREIIIVPPNFQVLTLARPYRAKEKDSPSPTMYIY